MLSAASHSYSGAGSAPASALPPGAHHLPPVKQIQMALDLKVNLADRIRDVERFLCHALGGATSPSSPHSAHSAHPSSPASSSTCAKDLESVLPMLVRDIFCGSPAAAPGGQYGASPVGAGSGVGATPFGSKYRGWNLKGEENVLGKKSFM